MCSSKKGEILVTDTYSYIIGVAHGETIVSTIYSHLHESMIDTSIVCSSFPKEYTVRYLTDGLDKMKKKKEEHLNDLNPSDNVSEAGSVASYLQPTHQNK